MNTRREVFRRSYSYPYAYSVRVRQTRPCAPAGRGGGTGEQPGAWLLRAGRTPAIVLDDSQEGHDTMAVQRESNELDEAKIEAFMEKALGDISGAMAIGLCHLGDRLGLFKDLAAHSPAGSEELAGRLDLNERYVREWLRGMTAAGYLEETGARPLRPPRRVRARPGGRIGAHVSRRCLPDAARRPGAVSNG